jgi:Xaa-Pro dipeptidase
MIATPDDAKQHFPTSGRTAFLGEGEENPEDVLNALHFDRAWKTDYELECLRRANERGARGHRATERAFRDGASEYEMHNEYLRATDHTEEELPYGNIIALNEHASVLHYVNHDREPVDPARRHSFLIDAGASVNGYASDITRTYASDGDEFRDLVAAMDDAQQSLCAAVKPGVPYPDIHMLAHRRVAEILVRFKFVKELDADGVVEKKLSSTFLPHGVGHYLGLQVHDVGAFMADRSGKVIEKPEGHPYLRLTRKVEPRQVFTIEPGLYFIEPLLKELAASENTKYVNWPKVDSFRKFGGIRIEDNIAVTETGYENMTRKAFA